MDEEQSAELTDEQKLIEGYVDRAYLILERIQSKNTNDAEDFPSLFRAVIRDVPQK